jgi:CDP-diacylglycerol--glycerol-3-phosphate 3-phosphatidyltransferase
VNILLDCLRGTRGKENSVSLLQPLLAQFPDRVQLYLFHTPLLHGLLKKILPPRVNEIIGVHHIKAYIFDDDLLISG